MAEQAQSPRLLILPTPGGDLTGVDVPKPTDNIFSRIIRNPARKDRPMRERRCAELLCAVLLNCPGLRRVILHGFASAAGQPIDQLDDLEWEIETECSIGRKRDDLRIEGFLTEGERRRRIILWTVEIKVWAPFHQSSSISEPLDDADAEKLSVNQINNYDEWLASEVSAHKAGFVVAITDQANNLPKSLKCDWSCLTWTGLGELIYQSLSAGELPDTDSMWGKHLLGFIQQHLWSSSVAQEQQLTFDHIAFIRANHAFGMDVSRYVANIVKPLEGVLNQSSVTTADAIEVSTLFNSLNRVAWKSILSKSPREVTLFTGLSGDSITVWIETDPKHEKKTELTRRLKDAIRSVKSPRSIWQFEVGPTSWWDVYTSIPIESLLAAEDQQDQVVSFVCGALDDLAEARIPELIRECTSDG